ncbi:P-loop containing nucleoside triphosphate hydrolase [Parasponia andersonii]|uniref:P-loop containing nucleoside triphosphate hydrolase n=1 Tax=Parasponia andersonii TaxID=3476 RepID=A0A2P5CUZ9_PARAD|nr:P-loop containing nucleoside triphosphate hydrolase [Parasponia andersonii]
MTCTFIGNNKIGVVGRTGNGNSTLIQAILRVLELSGGQNPVDEVNIVTFHFRLNKFRPPDIVGQDQRLLEAPATDDVIQETIRAEPSGCTVITVAHRIPTVINNDLVLVLDDGKLRNRVKYFELFGLLIAAVANFEFSRTLQFY